MGNCMSWCELLGRLGSQKALRRTFSFHCHDLSHRNSHKYDPGKEQKSYLDSEGNVTVLFRTTEDLELHYVLGAELGRGQFGLIRLCTDKQTGERFACKSIQKSKLLTAADVADVRREIRVMERLAGHPNIVELKAVHEDEEWVHLVMELCEGGELFDYITKKKIFTEEEAAQVCTTLMEVLQFCHAKGVIHRDLKPENILLAKRDSLLPIKVADFGLAINMRRGERFFGLAGSAYYIAPEVLRGDYGEEIDVWSAGVILYILLSGVPPFWDDTEDGIFEAIQFGHLDLSSSPWPSMSSAVKDLLKGMLCPDVKRRLTPEQVLNHRWILRNCSSSNAKGSLTSLTDTSYSWNPWPTLRSSSGSSFSSESETSDYAEIATASSLEDHVPFEVTSLDSTALLKIGAVCDNRKSAGDSQKCVDELVRGEAGGAELNIGSQHKNHHICSIGMSNSENHGVERWNSVTGVVQPTLAELLMTVVADIEHLSLPSAPASTQVQIQEECTCTIMKSSCAKDALVLDAFDRKFLVVHDKERRTIGWKQIEQHDQALSSPHYLGSLIWSAIPGSLPQFCKQEAVC